MPLGFDWCFDADDDNARFSAVHEIVDAGNPPEKATVRRYAANVNDSGDGIVYEMFHVDETEETTHTIFRGVCRDAGAACEMADTALRLLEQCRIDANHVLRAAHAALQPPPAAESRTFFTAGRPARRFP